MVACTLNCANGWVTAATLSISSLVNVSFLASGIEHVPPIESFVGSFALFTKGSRMKQN